MKSINYAILNSWAKVSFKFENVPDEIVVFIKGGKVVVTTAMYTD